MTPPSERLPIVPELGQVAPRARETDGIREKLVKAIVIFVKGAASRILLIPSAQVLDIEAPEEVPTLVISARRDEPEKSPEGNSAMAIKDAKQFKETFHAFLLLFPSESQEPDNRELKDLRSIFQHASRTFEKLTTTDAGAATMLGINIQAKSSSFVVQGIQKSHKIKDLFFSPTLEQIPLERLMVLRENLPPEKVDKKDENKKVKEIVKDQKEKKKRLYGALAEANRQGIDGEMLSHYMSRFNLIIEAYWQKLEEAIREANAYRQDAIRPQQALRTITEYTLEVLNRTLEQALWEEEGHRIDHHETESGARSGRDNEDMSDHHVLPPPSTTLEELLEHAHELVIPAGMRQIDLFSREEYLHARVASSGIKRESLLEIISEEKLGLLLKIDHETFRTLSKLKRNMQLLSLPAEVPDLEGDPEEAKLRAFATRHLMLFKYKPEEGYHPSPSQWLSDSEGGEDQEQFQNELWFLYFTARDAFNRAGSLEELLDIFFPGIDHEFLLPQSGQRPHETDDPPFPFNRFRFWAGAAGEYFDNIGRHDISLFLENFFQGLEGQDRQAWDEIRLFSNLKTVARSQPKEKKSQKDVRQRALEPWRPLADVTGLEFLDHPKDFQELTVMLEPLRKLDRWLRIIIRQHLLKNDPRLLTRPGRVIRSQKAEIQIDGNGKQVVTFVEAAPGELWVVTFDPHD